MINLHEIGNPWKKGLEIWRISKYFKNIDMYTLIGSTFLKFIQGLFWGIFSKVMMQMME